jgi:hypothetical protein
MSYLHYSDKKIDVFHDVKQKNISPSMKPKGLWLSYGKEWYDWCIENEFSTCNMSKCFIYSANIDKTNLLVISSLEDLNTFCENYSIQLYGFYYIDWTKVSEKYDGICFENYHETKEKIGLSDTMKNCWYLGIDINSACIWNPKRVIKEWKLV